MIENDGQAEVESKLKDGVAYVPLASIVRQLGGEISWDNEAKMATMTVRGRNAQVDLNDRIVTIDGQERILDSNPFVEDGRVYVTPDFLDQLGLTHT